MYKLIYAHHNQTPSDFNAVFREDLYGYERTIEDFWVNGFARHVDPASFHPIPFFRPPSWPLSTGKAILIPAPSDQLQKSMEDLRESMQANPDRCYIFVRDMGLQIDRDFYLDKEAQLTVLRIGGFDESPMPNIMIDKGLLKKSALEHYTRLLVVPHVDLTPEIAAAKLSHLFSRAKAIPDIFCFELNGISAVEQAAEMLGVRCFHIPATGHLKHDLTYVQMSTHVVDFADPVLKDLSNALSRTCAFHRCAKYRCTSLVVNQPVQAATQSDVVDAPQAVPPTPLPEASVVTPVAAPRPIEQQPQAPTANQSDEAVLQAAQMLKGSLGFVPLKTLQSTGVTPVGAEPKAGGAGLSDRVFCLLDISNVIDRAYHVARKRANPDGIEVGCVIQFLKMMVNIKKAVSQNRSDGKIVHLVALADARGRYFRHEIYADYKQRSKREFDHELQKALIIMSLPLYGVPIYLRPNFEADDCIASITRQLVLAGAYGVEIVSSDKDLMTLVDDAANIVQRPGPDYQPLNESLVTSKPDFNGISNPKQIRDVLSLASDRVDGIPGIKGVGFKTAVQLISRFGSLHGLYENTEGILEMELRGKNRIKDLVEAGKEGAMLSWELIGLRDDLDFNVASIMADIGRLNQASVEMDQYVQVFGQLLGLPEKVEPYGPNDATKGFSELIRMVMRQEVGAAFAT